MGNVRRTDGEFDMQPFPICNSGGFSGQVAISDFFGGTLKGVGGRKKELNENQNTITDKLSHTSISDVKVLHI
jgi:hypothetical protein